MGKSLKGARPFVNVRCDDGSRATFFAVRTGPGGVRRDEAVPVLRIMLANNTLRAFAEGALLRDGSTVPMAWLPDDLRDALKAATTEARP